MVKIVKKPKNKRIVKYSTKDLFTGEDSELEYDTKTKKSKIKGVKAPLPKYSFNF